MKTETVETVLYIYKQKFSFESEFKTVVLTCEMQSSESCTYVLVDTVVFKHELPVFSDAELVNEEIEQLKLAKIELQSRVGVELNKIDEKIQSLLALESK